MKQTNVDLQDLASDGILMELFDEITAKLDAGQPVDLDPYEREHPDCVAELRQLLPTLEAMIKLGYSPEGGQALMQSDSGSPGEVLNKGTLGDFRIIGEVGRGGMGVVYEAEQISLGRRVALKVLPFAAVLDPRHLQRFKNEAMAAASLDHPNIVSVYSVGCERAVHFYAMQFVEGQTVAKVIA